jgi:hypothetical protein
VTIKPCCAKNVPTESHGALAFEAAGSRPKDEADFHRVLAGVHVIGLVNTLSFSKMGAGHLGTDQLDFIQKDVAPLSSDTPVIVFSHFPLFAVYPAWGWGTDDATQALSYLRRSRR